MKNAFALVLALALALSLAACDDAGISGDSIAATPPASRGNSETQPPHTGGRSAAESTPPESSIVNEALISLIGRPLSAFERDPDEAYYYYNIGSSRDVLEYYNPYIHFDINSVMSGKGGPSPNPLTSENALVQSASLKDEIDPESGAVADQSSLKQLFITDEVITYALLCEELQQTPQLAHYPDGGYYAVVPFSMENRQCTVNGGIYEAVFELLDEPTMVCFIAQGDDCIAYSASFGSGEYVWPTGDTSNQSDDVLLAHDTLQEYLKDMWGMGQDDHNYVFDSIIVIDNIELYVFDIFHKPENEPWEFDYRFAISVKKEVVYIFDTNLQAWAECKDPDPWPGW